MLSLEEIKKRIAEVKPRADLFKITQHGIFYIALMPLETHRKEAIFFIITLSEIADKVYYDRMESEKLIDYLIHPDSIQP